jgi:DNA-directed RNA polymerase subunit RPC12/RpoP
MAAVTGKRYKCTDCGAEFIVTRGADEGELRCGDSPLEQL